MSKNDNMNNENSHWNKKNNKIRTIEDMTKKYTRAGQRKKPCKGTGTGTRKRTKTKREREQKKERKRERWRKKRRTETGTWTRVGKGTRTRTETRTERNEDKSYMDMAALYTAQSEPLTQSKPSRHSVGSGCRTSAVSISCHRRSSHYRNQSASSFPSRRLSLWIRKYQE